MQIAGYEHDHHVSFNAAKGFNSGAQGSQDNALVHEWNPREDYIVSVLEARLRARQQFTNPGDIDSVGRFDRTDLLTNLAHAAIFIGNDACMIDSEYDLGEPCTKCA